MHRACRHMLDQLGAASFEIRQKRDLEQPMDGLILPGRREHRAWASSCGDLDLFETLQRRRSAAGLPVFGTCAGLILLARPGGGRHPPLLRHHGSSPPSATPTGGSWAASHTVAQMEGRGTRSPSYLHPRPLHRRNVGPKAQVLGTKWTASIVAARQGNQLVTGLPPGTG